MKEGYSVPLADPLYGQPPLHYVDAKVFLALFFATEESLEKILPHPLRPSEMRMAGLMFGEMPCKETGAFMESGLLVQCMFDNPDTGEDEIGVHFAHNYVDTDVALAMGREVWGYPRKLADISMKWKGDKLVGKTVRHGATLFKATCTFTDEGEWIDSGPNVNVKRIQNASGDGFDSSYISAADLKYDVKNGRSGEVEIEFQDGPHDKVTIVEMESPMIALYFDTDILVPKARVIIPMK
ncbi:MAG: acetoacetate decarboxylase family protein [Candidatus Thorarchaeota archaeon]|jgi:acetoacetate decarboxylase